MNEQQLQQLKKGDPVVYKAVVGIVNEISEDVIFILIDGEEIRKIVKEKFAYLFPTIPDIEKESSWFAARFKEVLSEKLPVNKEIKATVIGYWKDLCLAIEKQHKIIPDVEEDKKLKPEEKAMMYQSPNEIKHRIEKYFVAIEEANQQIAKIKIYDHSYLSFND
jgi:hypothetical protein